MKVKWILLSLILLIIMFSAGGLLSNAANPNHQIQKFDPAAIHRIGDYTFIPFSLFTSFNYSPAIQTAVKDAESPIPSYIKELDGKKIATEGFMLPLSVPEKGKLKSFLLLIDRMGCCFGKFPPPNGLIYVTMAGSEAADYSRFNSVTVYGTLEAGEQVELDGSRSLFRMSAEKAEVSGTLKPWWQFW